MSSIELSKQQSKTFAQAVYDGIKHHCEDNFERYITEYFGEVRSANGQPIEPITIRFLPVNHFVGQRQRSIDNVEDGIVEGISQ